MKDWGKLSHFGIFDEIIRKASRDYLVRNEDNVIHAIEYIEAGLPSELRTGGCDDAPLSNYVISSDFEEKMRTNNRGRQIHNKNPYRPLDIYKTEEAVINCKQYFADFKVLSRIKELDSFINDLFSMAKYFEVSIFGILYLESLKSEPLMLLSEFYVFSVIWEEPHWWKKNYETLLNSVDLYRIHNLAFNKSKNYIYRYASLEKILPLIAPGERVLLYGIPGNGKTQLALEICHISLLRKMTVVWCDASSETTLIRAYKEFLSAVDNLIINDSVSRVIIKLSEWCSKNENWLFVFDNYKSEAYREFDSIEALLPKSSKGCFLFTSVKKEELSDVEYVKVNSFTQEEARDFLSHGLKRNASNNDIYALVERLGNLPLALSQAVIYLNKNPEISIDYYVDLLNEASVSFHEEKSGDVQHSASVYASIVMNISSLLGKSDLNNKACFLLFVLSYFPESGISGHFLNRSCFYPYRYNCDNYEISGNVVKPYLYSNAGYIAIDSRTKKILDLMGFKIYDKKYFLQLVQILSESGLCDIICGEDPYHIKAYFGKVTYIRTHKLVQESAREFLTTSDRFNSGDFPKSVVDLLLRLIHMMSSAKKPYIYYGEIIELSEIHSSITRNIATSPFALTEYNYRLYRQALIITSTIDQLTTNYFSKDFTGCTIPFDQFLRWDIIFDITHKFEPEFSFLREFEYCSLFTPLKFENNTEHLDKAFALLREVLEKYFSSIEDPSEREKAVDNLYNYLKSELDKTINASDFKEYRIIINHIIDSLYELFTDAKDRIDGCGFGAIQVMNQELASEIKKIFVSNGISVTELGFRTDDSVAEKVLGFVPENSGDSLIQRCYV